MTAAELVADIERRGVRLTPHPDGGALVAEPKGALTPTERAELINRKPEVLALLRNRRHAELIAEAARWPLWKLPAPVEVFVPWAPVTIFIVPGPGLARQLEEDGIGRGRIWTASEVLDLLLTNVPRDDARSIAEAKFMFAGTLKGTQAKVTQ